MNEQENKAEKDAILDLAEAFEQLYDTVKAFIENIKKTLGVLDDTELIEPIIIPDKQIRTIPPRQSRSRARSPNVQRWWVNYKARDKLPCKCLKSGGKGQCRR